MQVKTFIIDDDEDDQVIAESFEDALEQMLGGLVYKEVSKNDWYDFSIQCEGIEKYIWVRSG